MAKRQTKIRRAPGRKTSAARGLEDWWRVCLILERFGGSISGFLDTSKIPRATLNRIRNGGAVSEANRRLLCRAFGYSRDIWDPLPDASRPLRELEVEFFKWLDARSHARSTTGEAPPVRHLDFLLATPAKLVGRSAELRKIDDHIDQQTRGIIEIRGPSGSGKTELIRGWWIESGKRIVDGHSLAFSCRRLGTSDALFDTLRSAVGATDQDGADLLSRIVRSLSRASARANVIILDDLDFLMQSWSVDESKPTHTGLRFDRAALRELLSKLLLELEPITLVVTTSKSLEHVFGAYPGYLLVDLKEGLPPGAGSALVSQLLRNAIGTAKMPVTPAWLEDASLQFRGQPQSLVLLASLIQQTPKKTLPAAVGLMRASVERSNLADAEPTALNIASRLSRRSLNFVRMVAAADRGLGATMLKAFVDDQLAKEPADRIFFEAGIPADTQADTEIGATFGLVDDLPGETEQVFDMHMVARTAILKDWQKSEPRSFERLQNWFGRYCWQKAFAGVTTGFHPRALPEAPAQRLASLLGLVNSAYHLLRGAAGAVEQPPNTASIPRSPAEENRLARDKVLSLADIEYVFSHHASPKLRVEFAYRRIVAQRVDRVDRNTRSKSKHRYGLTRRYGRHEEKMRLLSLMAPDLLDGQGGESNLLDLIEPSEQGQVVFDIAHNALQLGWLDMAQRAFEDAIRRSGLAEQPLEVCRGRILLALTHMTSGDLASAREQLSQAVPALESTWKTIASLPEDHRAEPERQVRAMDRRLQSFIARHALLTGNIEQAAHIDANIHQAIQEANEADNQFLATMRANIAAGALVPEIAGQSLAVPEVALLGDRGRLHIATELVRDPQQADAQLGYWWACYQIATDDGVEVEHTHLHILEAAIHRLRGDPRQAARALLDGSRINDRYNVHFPVRMEWRLERARCELCTPKADARALDNHARQIDTLIELALDYGFKLLECDGSIVRAWFASTKGDIAKANVCLDRARRIIEETGYQLRKADVELVESHGRPVMVPLI